MSERIMVSGMLDHAQWWKHSNGEEREVLVSVREQARRRAESYCEARHEWNH